MFIGRYYHTLEEKGRVSLPKEFRQVEENWVVTRGLDGGLFLFRAQDFEQELHKLAERSFTRKAHRDFIRLMSNDAKAIRADNNGRVSLPEYLIELAGITKEVVIVGSYARVELWDRDRYHHYLDELEEQAESIAEQLTEQIETA